MAAVVKGNAEPIYTVLNHAETIISRFNHFTMIREGHVLGAGQLTNEAHLQLSGLRQLLSWSEHTQP